MPKNQCAWIGMYEYGNYVCDLDINKLDKNICEIDNSNDKVKVYYL